MEAPSTSNHNISPATQSNSGRPIRSNRRQCLPLLVDNMPEENGYSSGSEEVVPLCVCLIGTDIHMYGGEEIF